MEGWIIEYYIVIFVMMCIVVGYRFMIVVYCYGEIFLRDIVRYLWIVVD